jgi:hypothetical protein
MFADVFAGEVDSSFAQSLILKENATIDFAAQER